MTMTAAGRKKGWGQAPRDGSLAERAYRLLGAEIDFIANRQFADAAGETGERISGTLPVEPGTAPNDLPSHLRRLCETELLSQKDEAALFRGMNLLKFQASLLRAELDPETATDEELNAIETRLAQAQAIRDHIIRANMRLVMAIVKKFVSPQQSFDEMLSDGIVTLMQAVEKFDFDRGFRFSTYAYRSIARNAYRTVTAARKEEARFTRDAEEWAFEQEDVETASSMTDQVWNNLRQMMAAMLDQLDRREQFIIRSRYALGAHRRVRTFQDLASKLGVSKERVRQLEQRAVGKMRAMAGELDIDQPLVAAVM